MEAEIKATQDIKILKENLEKRVEKIYEENGKLIAEVEELEVLEKTPGIEEYKVNGETIEGLKGRPVQKEAYIKIDDKEDVVKALIATIDGYDLRVLNTSLKWDLKLLKKYNPDIKHLKFNEPQDILEIDKAINFEHTKTIDMDINQEDIDFIYKEMLV